MFHYDEDNYVFKQQSEYFNILSLDPSSNYAGVAILKVRAMDMKLMSIESHHLNMNIHNKKVFEVEHLYYRMTIFESFVISLLETYNPIVVCHETAFMNRGTPSAFKPLIQSTYIFTDTSLKFNPNVKIKTFTPPQVKNALGQKGNCKKEDMMEACLRDETINQFINPALLTEHEIDAIAVGLCALNFYNDKKLLLA